MYEDEQKSEITSDVKYRIGFFSGGLLIFLAIIADVVELILDLVSFATGGWIVDIIELLLIVPIFYLNGVNVWMGRLGPQWLILIVISFVPFLSTIVPEMLIAVLLTIYISRIEDREKGGDQGDLIGLAENFKDRYSKISRKKRTGVKPPPLPFKGKVGLVNKNITRPKRLKPPPLPKK